MSGSAGSELNCLELCISDFGIACSGIIMSTAFLIKLLITPFFGMKLYFFFSWILFSCCFHWWAQLWCQLLFTCFLRFCVKVVRLVPILTWHVGWDWSNMKIYLFLLMFSCYFPKSDNKFITYRNFLNSQVWWYEMDNLRWVDVAPKERYG